MPAIEPPYRVVVEPTDGTDDKAVVLNRPWCPACCLCETTAGACECRCRCGQVQRSSFGASFFDRARRVERNRKTWPEPRGCGKRR